MPNRKAIYIRVSRTGTSIWMLWLIHFHCVWKKDILLKCPRDISSNSASSFNPQTKPVSPFPWEPSHFSLHPSWIIIILLLQISWTLFSKHPSLLNSTTHFLHTSTQTAEQSWRNITQLNRLPSLYIYNHLPRVSPRQCPLILLFFSSSSFSILYVFQFLWTSHTHSQVMTCLQLHCANKRN